MSAIQQLITEHFDIWTAADTGPKSGRGRSSANAAKVYGISKLRELILELAVRGKLVPQDANDEPASELLRRIEAEKARLVAESKAKKDKPLPPIANEETSFELPRGWEWVRLGAVQTFTNGYAFKSHDFQSSGIGVIRIGDVGNNGEIQTSSMLYFPFDREAEIPEKFKVNFGDLVISMTGNVKLAFNNSDKVYFLNQRVGKIEPHLVSKFYLYRFLTTVAQEKIDNASGGVIPNVSTEEINETVIPLPPLAEQHRIVAKVDELMALCDQLETEHNNATEAHEKLVSHLLVTLTQSQSAEDFSDNWQRIATHFDTLFTTEASIDALKQTLLQLAVMGKLVPQDPNDEPASELLKSIQAKKATLVAGKRLRKDKPLPPITGEEKSFNLPAGWEWVRLGSIIDYVNGFAFSSKDFSANGIGVVKIGDIQNGRIEPAYMSRVSENIVVGLDERLKVEFGDLVIAMSGATTGKLGFNDTEDVFYLNQRVGKIITYGISKKFLYFDLTTKIADNLSKSFGSAIPNLSTEQINEIIIALPPATEQHRIVFKVDELMTLCEQLKFRIIEVSQLQQRLADAVVEKAVV